MIGGILGDHPPKGRTWKYLTSRMEGVECRSLGEHQLPIYCAVYVAWMVWRGFNLEDIPLTFGVEINVESFSDVKHTIYLPYAYPIVDGKPYIPKRLENLLKRGLPYIETIKW